MTDEDSDARGGTSSNDRAQAPSRRDQGGAPSFSRPLPDVPFGSVAAGMAFMFSTLKVLAVGHYDITTALALVAEAPTATLVLGTFLNALRLLLFTLTVVALYYFRRDGVLPETKRVCRFVAIVSATVASLLAPIPEAAFIVALTLIVLNIERLQRVLQRLSPIRNRLNPRTAVSAAHAGGTSPKLHNRMLKLKTPRPSSESREGEVSQMDSTTDPKVDSPARTAGSLAGRRQQKPYVLRFLAVFYLVVLIPELLSSRPWLPAERVTFDNATAVTGYVLHITDSDTVMLVDQPRRVQRFPSSAKARTFCRTQPAFEAVLDRPVVSLLFEAPMYPSCAAVS